MPLGRLLLLLLLLLLLPRWRRRQLWLLLLLQLRLWLWPTLPHWFADRVPLLSSARPRHSTWSDRKSLIREPRAHDALHLIAD